MAKKLNITRATVLAAVIEGDMDILQTPDAIECAKRMLASITRKSDTSNEPSKAAKENIALAEEVLKIMPEGGYLLTFEIMEKVKGIMTPQKCTKVMDVLVSTGKVERVPKAKGRYTGYKLM